LAPTQQVKSSNIISEQIRDIPGAINISDDIIIFGKTQQTHDQALHAVLQRFSEVGLTIGPERCELNKESLTFFGLVFSAKGVSPDPKKVKAIHDACPQASVGEARSFSWHGHLLCQIHPQFQ